MPELENIEQFKSGLNAIAHEEEILEARGETLEDVAPPEDGLSDDLSMLLGGDEAGPDVAAPEVPTPDETAAGAGAAGTEADATPVPADEQLEGIDFDDLGDLGDVVVTDEEEEPAVGEPAAGEPAAGEPAAGEPAAGVPEAPEDGIESFDIDGIFPDEGEVPAAGEPAAGEPAAGVPAAGVPAAEAEAPAAEAEPAPEEPEVPPGTAEPDFGPVPEEPELEAELPEDILFEAPGEPSAEEAPPVEGISEAEYDGLTEGFEGFEAEEPPEAEGVEPGVPEPESLTTEDTGLVDFDLPEGLDFEDEAPVDEAEEGATPAAPEEAPSPEEPPVGETLDEFSFEEPVAAEEATGGEGPTEISEIPESGESLDFDELPDFEEPGVDEAVFGEGEAPEEVPAPELPAEEAFGAEGEPAPEAEPPGEPLAEEEAVGEEAFAGEGIEEEEFEGEAEEFTVPEEFAFEETPVDEAPGEPEAPEAGAIEAGAEDFELPEEFTFEEEGEAGIEAGPVPAGAEEEEAPSEEIGAPPEGVAPGEPAAGEPAAGAPAEVSEDDFDLDDFSLGDIGEQFGITEEETTEAPPAEEELNPALAVSAELPAEEMELELSDEEFEDLQITLSGLPRNLRIIIEELIGEQQLTGENLDTLVSALVTGRSAREIAAITGRITGQRIVIPAQYEKKTGLELEAEIGTFAYTFRHNILPVLRTLLLSLIAAGILGLLIYQLAYRPIRATVLYNRGYNALTEGRFLPANENFYRASDTWRMKGRFYEYAEGFSEMNRDDLAAEKYDELLFYYPNDRKGILDYARFEIYERARYQHAEDLLDRILEKDLDNYDALLLNGDLNMEWALEDPSRYERARLSYATLLQEYGSEDEVMFRMLRYFIRTNDMQEVLRLKDYFQESEKIEVDPEVYAELGGYLVANDTLGDVQSILFRALEADENLPEIHYNLARFFRKVERSSEERKALINAYRLLTNEDRRTLEHEKMLIDTINRQGESYYREQAYLDAEKKYIEALSLYEDGLERDRLEPEPQFGKVYSNLGDIYYYISGDYASAGNDYTLAEQNAYSPPVLKYKIGVIEYLNKNYEDALLRFHTAAGDYSTNVNLMFSTANTLYNRNDYSAAQGYYLHVLDVLEAQRRNIPILRPDERRDHRALLENIIKVNNNLGVTLYYLSRQSGENQKVSQGLVNLTRSSELYDQLSRDTETLVRSASKNLSFINMRAILYPESDFGLEIYQNVPRDFTELEF